MPQAVIPAAAECTKANFASFDPALEGLPVGYMVYTEDQQAKALLKIKARDAVKYITLRTTAIRCAPEK